MKVISKRTWLRSTFMLALGILVLVVLLRNVGFRKLFETLRRASFPHVLLSAGTLCSFYLLRAVRWTIILRRRVSPMPLFLYSSIGYLVSSVMPLQMGELLKPGFLRVRHGIPYLEGLASVAFERLLDIAGLVLLGTVALVTTPSSLLGAHWLVGSLRVAGILSTACLLILVIAVFKAPQVVVMASKVLEHLPLPETFKATGVAAVSSLLQGAAIVTAPAYLVLAIMCTVVLWGMNYVSVALIFHALGTSLHPAGIMLGFVLLSVGLIIPLSPGYVGQYEALWVFVFLALGVRPQSMVVALGLISHGIILLVIGSLGILSLVLIPIPVWELFAWSQLDTKLQSSGPSSETASQE